MLLTGGRACAARGSGVEGFPATTRLVVSLGGRSFSRQVLEFMETNLETVIKV
jgi:hypothetical protein